MQEIKKRRILLASTLKPVDDTRMYEKLGLSLAERFDVHIAGTAATPVPGVHAYVHSQMKRFSLRRVLLPAKIFFLALRLRPDVFIFCTHELLFPAVLLRLFRRTRVIYDVQENYKLNILHTKAFPNYLRNMVATWVRMKERFCAPFLSRVFFAERTYATEMPFLAGKAVVLENKVSGAPLMAVPIRPKNELIFTGTLSSGTGVFTAIDLATALWETDPSVRLTIAGYCAMPGELSRIRAACADKSFITFIGGDELVPHHQILSLIAKAGFGVIAYERSPATKDRIPTKLYEYLGNCLPVLISGDSPGVSQCLEYEAGMTFHPRSIDAASLLDRMNRDQFYPRIPADVFWTTEALKLLAALDFAK